MLFLQEWSGKPLPGCSNLGTVWNIELVDNFQLFTHAFLWLITYVLWKVFHSVGTSGWQMLALQVRHQTLILQEALYHYVGGFGYFHYHRHGSLLEALAFSKMVKLDTTWELNQFWIFSFSNMKKAWLLDSENQWYLVNLMPILLSITSMTSCNSKIQFAAGWITSSRVCRVVTRLEMMVKSKFKLSAYPLWICSGVVTIAP